MTTFHQRLKDLCKESQKSQAKIAEDLKITPQAFSYYIKGREPSYELLTNIAKYFNVSTDYLLGMTDAKNNDTVTSINRGLQALGTNMIEFPSSSNSAIERLNFAYYMARKTGNVDVVGALDNLMYGYVDVLYKIDSFVDGADVMRKDALSQLLNSIYSLKEDVAQNVEVAISDTLIVILEDFITSKVNKDDAEALLQHIQDFDSNSKIVSVPVDELIERMKTWEIDAKEVAAEAEKMLNKEG